MFESVSEENYSVPWSQIRHTAENPTKQHNVDLQDLRLQLLSLSLSLRLKKLFFDQPARKVLGAHPIYLDQ